MPARHARHAVDHGVRVPALSMIGDPTAAATEHNLPDGLRDENIVVVDSPGDGLGDDKSRPSGPQAMLTPETGPAAPRPRVQVTHVISEMPGTTAPPAGSRSTENPAPFAAPQ
jgi:hypothetical protein